MRKLLFQNARVYCGTYHKYNSGSLRGEWVNLTEFSDSIVLDEYLRDLHNDEADPEFMFQDKENMPYFVDGEPSWSEVVKTVELANYLWDAWIDEDIINAAFCHEEDLKDKTPEEIEKWLTVHYVGQADDDRYVDDWLDENLIPDHVRDFIDRERLKEHITDGYNESDGYYFL